MRPSQVPFARAFPAEKIEAFLAGHTSTFECLLALPERPHACCVTKLAVVSKTSLITLDRHLVQVPGKSGEASYRYRGTVVEGGVGNN